MKIDSITTGNHEVGPFTITISRCIFETIPIDQANFFEVLLSEKKEMDGWGEVVLYVPIVEDADFNFYQHFYKFERHLTNEDVVEYNSHVNSVFYNIDQTTYKLSRHSIIRLFDQCESLAKKKKKQMAAARKKTS